MAGPAVILLASVAIALALAAIYIILRFRENRRTEHLQQVAAELSFDFRGKDEALLARLGDFRLCSQGHSREVKNVLRGTSSDVEVAIFDYRYIDGSGNDSVTYRQTGICFQSRRLALANFEVRPKGWFHKLATIFGSRDIDFPDYPEFSARYLLRSSDEEGVRRLFTAPVIEHLETLANVCVEGRGDRLMFYRPGERVEPIDVRQFLETGFGLFSVLVSQVENENLPVLNSAVL